MNALLEQFISESRECLQGIGEKLLQLEDAPGDKELVNELFRLVHTLKGNSGLFEFPTMTRVLHAGEDLMDEVRNDRVVFSRQIADHLLDSMDFVGLLCDEVEASGGQLTSGKGNSVRLAEGLRLLIPVKAARAADPAVVAPPAPSPAGDLEGLDGIPEAVRMEAYGMDRQAGLHLVRYRPAADCFYQGADPFHQARQTPGLLWGWLCPREPWPCLEAMDAYRCVLDFQVLTAAPLDALEEHYRYVLEQVQMVPVPGLCLVLPQGEPNGGPVYEDFVAEAMGLLAAGNLRDLAKITQALLDLSNPDLWLSSALRWLLAALVREPGNLAALKALIGSLETFQPPRWAAVTSMPQEPPPAVCDPAVAVTAHATIAIQRTILAIDDRSPWQRGRIQAATATLSLCLKALGHNGDNLEGLAAALEAALAAGLGTPVVSWLDNLIGPVAPARRLPAPPVELLPEPPVEVPAPPVEGEVKFGRRAEDAQAGAKSLKVDQTKVDRLMNLIGEMVVSKNALPYLAGRAESVFGVRELSREIKAQYSVINRIAEEMQDAIMQVRMMPVSFVFQRFPRLVRDTSRKLGKEVNLVLIGEDTQADKNIIEALGDPLVHIVRNSLDHGFESPETRLAAGKPAAGTLTLRASQESDRVVIEVEDDGKGIDPLVIKRKAYEKGVIDEATLERISDHDAINLIFAPGLSTADVVSDLSGRGVGMDVVRTAVEKVNGSLRLDSELGKGTRLSLSLPLSMAVTNVMIVETDGQTFGLPMQSVIETVRVPRARVMHIKNTQATVLRGRIVALKSLNEKLGIAAAPRANADGELAVLVVRAGNEQVGLIVDQFHETQDVILKPMTGVLGGLSAYAGSALMGDGSVLMILNVMEIL
jgi:two-component system chemotaxis sensor kinase CheA